MISLILSSLTDPIILVLKQICFTYGYISSCRICFPFFAFHFFQMISDLHVFDLECGYAKSKQGYF